jgi:hypothetical protein
MNAEALIKFYLDYVNNYLSSNGIADAYGFSVEFARAAIAEGRRLHELAGRPTT